MDDFSDVEGLVAAAAAAAGFGGGPYRILQTGTTIVLVGSVDGLVARVPSADPPVEDWDAHLGMVETLERSGAPFLCPCGPPRFSPMAVS